MAMPPQSPHQRHPTTASGEPPDTRQRAAPYPATRRDDSSREALRRRICKEFEDMPGMTVTLPQLQRLFDLRTDVCARVVNELMQQGFLARTADGQVRCRMTAC